MKRNKFLILSGLGITAVAVPTWYYKFYKLDNDQILAQPELLSQLWDGPAIAQIGTLYRQQFADENSKPRLLAHLMVFTSTDTAITIQQLEKQITDDYKQENTVLLDGWILSRTEARQCALFSLTQND